MNRRRVGLAALVVGAGAAVRQRMKTQSDPGAEASTVADANTPKTAVTETTVAETAAAATVPIANAETAATTASTPTGAGGPAEVSLGDPAIDIAAESTLGDPEIDLDVDMQPGVDPTIEIADAAASITETAPAIPAAAAALKPADPDAIPAIVLPTMPPAGSQAGTQSGTPARSSAVDPAASSENLPVTSLPLAKAPADADAPHVVDALPIAKSAALPVAEPDVGTIADPAITPAAALSNTATAEKEPFYRAHRGWSIAGSIFLGLVVVALIAGSVVRLPYYSLEPGSVYDTIERVEAPGDLVSIPQGEIGFVTVSQTANITPWQWLDAKLDNNVRIRHEDEVRGEQTADELREADIRRMTVSKNSAVVVALQRLGFDLVITPIGIEVSQVFDCTAADGTLGTGDLIVGVNGVEVLTGEQLVAELMNQGIGADVDLLVERIDPTNPTQSMRTDLVALTLGSADAACLPDNVRAEEPRPFIGIGTLPMFEEEFPIDIDLRTGTISGPSAGLAFTLAIIDVLSEGELTNGLSVVATGSIDRDGNVGPVGGIHQKTVAAERSGADVFIVPRCCDNFVDRVTGEPLDIPGNYEEALLYADDMIIIGVDTLDEALIALGELGGDVESFLTPAAP